MNLLRCNQQAPLGAGSSARRNRRVAPPARTSLYNLRNAKKIAQIRFSSLDHSSNSFERWLISITDMPVPLKSSNSAWASLQNFQGHTPTGIEIAGSL
ncbi:MAG: hypothetical protein U0Z26_18965 [Anaerolineales bacterium]